MPGQKRCLLKSGDTERLCGTSRYKVVGFLLGFVRAEFSIAGSACLRRQEGNFKGEAERLRNPLQSGDRRQYIT
ncbi:MAG: hypothetical protein ACRDX8_06240, partial [Acidimicrobiales bacterium]